MIATVWLVQRGSPESKELDKAGQESDEDQKIGRYADADSPSVGEGGRLADGDLLVVARRS